MTLLKTPQSIQIVNVLPQSPAQLCGVPCNSHIVQVNHTPLHKDVTVDQVAHLIQATPLQQPLRLIVTQHPDLVHWTTKTTTITTTNEQEQNPSPYAPCPYYLSRALATHAELVFCPYNYVLDPAIRSSLHMDLKDNIVVLDEAHNIEDCLRESGSGHFGEFELCDIIVMLNHFAGPYQTTQVPVLEETWALQELAHDLLVVIESILFFLIDGKSQFEQRHAPKVLQEWKLYKTPDETEFDMTLDGPTGHGVQGKAVGCQTFFDKLLLQQQHDWTVLQHYGEALDSHVRSKPESWEHDKFSATLDKMTHLLTLLAYADEHAEHYYIASVAKANGSLEYASTGKVPSDNRFPREPQKVPLMPPRTANKSNIPLDVCLVPTCRQTKTGPSCVDGNVRHGEFCNGSMPPWEAWLVIELLTPSGMFQDLRDQCRSVILASGSLAPIESLCAELGLEGCSDSSNKATALLTIQTLSTLDQEPSAKGGDKKDTTMVKENVGRLQVQPKPLEANHVINLEKQLLALSIGFFPDGSPLTCNFSNYGKGNFVEKLGDAIATVIESIPTGGVLVFLPSYTFLRKCIHKWNPNSCSTWEGGWSMQHESPIWERLIASKGKVIVEPAGSQSKFERARDEYAKTIVETGRCIMLAVFRGKMSEGISFNDENARGVICVGIPFPNAFDRSIKAKKNYNDEQRRLKGRTNVLPGNEWYSQQAYRAIAQALGRCIRHAADYGTVILMDSRHCDDGGPRNSEDGCSRVHRQLPKWMRHHVKNLSKSHTGDLYVNSISGGWNGLQIEMKRFFEEAPIHATHVLEQQKENMQRSQQSQNLFAEHAFNANTGNSTPSATASSQRGDLQVQPKEAALHDANQQVNAKSIVTPQSPMIFDLTEETM
jgi:Fanconi anemia group J protein